MSDFRIIKDKVMRAYFKQHDILNTKTLKHIAGYKYKDIVNTLNHNIKLINDIAKYKDGIVSLDFVFNEPEPKYAYIIRDMIGFDTTKANGIHTIVPRIYSFDTATKDRTIFSVGSYKLLQNAMVEAICCSVAFQYLYVLSGLPIDKYFDSPFNFYEKAKLKKKYNNYKSVVRIMKDIGLKEKLNLKEKKLMVVQGFAY